MNRKMDLLERAHGLLCNAPGEGGADHDLDAWRTLRAEWIERWHHVIRDHATKHHNKRVHIGNEAISGYNDRREQARRVSEEIGRLITTVPSPTVETNLRVVACDVHGIRALDMNSADRDQDMCEECRVVGPDGKPLGWQDGTEAA